jgi:glycosyltransferase involved in cell wall biosynthesis
MNILMLCYYFPPLMDVGTKRSIAFSEYFKKYGWNPYVISVRNPDKNYCTIGKDTPPAGITTEYTFSICNIYNFLGRLNGIMARLLKLADIKLRRNYLLDIFCIPDLFLGWIPLTVIKGIKCIKENNIDVIYVSCSPFSSAIIGVLLKKFTRKPLVIDFRDPFALKELSLLSEAPPWRVKINKAIENSIIKATDLFIVNTEEVRNAYMDQYPFSRGKIYAVPNGFDDRYLVKNEPPKYDKFTIIYAGQFYFFDKRNDIHTDAFFGALARLKSNNDISEKNFQFLYFGDAKEHISKLAKCYSVEDLVICSERKPYVEILQDIKSSHLQLLRISKPMISTKLFEGIALNIPFIATIPSGEVEGIINRYSPASYVITEASPKRIAEAILDSQNKYRCGHIESNKVGEFLQHYSRENLALKMIGIITKNIFIDNRNLKYSR